MRRILISPVPTSVIAIVALLLVSAIILPTACHADDCALGIITTVAGNGEAGFSGDGGPAADASFRHPKRVAVAPDGSFYIADCSNYRVRRAAADGVITTVAGTGTLASSGDGGPATEASLAAPWDVSLSPDGTLYISTVHGHRIRKIHLDGTISTVAGDGWTATNGMGRFAGDGGPATQASLNWPEGVAVGADGSLYIADTGNERIRKVDPNGIITTFAGGGEADADGVAAVEARLWTPRDLAMGPDGAVYIVESWRVRKVDSAGIITTVAGGGNPPDGLGDGGPAIEAKFFNANAIAVCPDGSFYVADTNNRRIRKVDIRGIITTVAGNGEAHYSGDDVPSTDTSVYEPEGVALAPDGSIYIADTKNQRIRMVWWVPCELSRAGPSWHMIAVPWVCRHPFPDAVFDELLPPLSPIDMLTGCLHRYDHDRQGYETYYDWAPTPFGPVTPGDGYWLWVTDPVQICYAADPPAEPVTVHFPTSGWYLFGSPRAEDVPVEACTVYHGGDALPFTDAANVWIQDPLLFYDAATHSYASCGVSPLDTDHHLRAFRGYWLHTFVDDVTLEVPPG